MRWLGLAALIVTVAGLVQAQSYWSEQPAESDEAQLAIILRDIEAGRFGPAGGGETRARKDKQKLLRGAKNFFRPFPGRQWPLVRHLPQSS